MRLRLLTTISIGLLSAACQGQYSQNAASGSLPAVYGGYYQSSEQACADYGFSTGTSAFDRCVSRERSARATGRVNRDYTQARLAADARDACYSYGLEAGTARYDRCVSREIDARAYREAASLPSRVDYRTDQYGNRIDSEGYRVDANGYRVAVTQPGRGDYPTDQYGNRVDYRTDQYGNRIDSQGYRVDNNGYRIDANGYAAPPLRVDYRTDSYGNRIDSQGYRIDANGYRIVR